MEIGKISDGGPMSKHSLVCANLPFGKRKNIGKILVTGASGYIGGRLVPELLARGYQVRVMVRGSKNLYERRWPEAEVVTADVTDRDSLVNALNGICSAYYLIHSLLLGPQDFDKADVSAAIAFRQVAEMQKVSRIIYLGGLGDLETSRSAHLRSRAKVASELARGNVPVTILRAAIIIGSGSASYDIIHHLARKLRLYLIPHWARNRCQPIAVADVIKYLVGVLENPECDGRSFDIGGEDILTYEQMIKIFGEIAHRKMLSMTIPFSNISIFSYITSLLTPVPAQITACLLEGIKDEAICRDNTIRKHVPFNRIGYREAIVRALTREEQDKVYTRWSDAYPPAHELALKLSELKGPPSFKAAYSLLSEVSSEALFKSVCKIGGDTGWFNNNWMWRARGGIDRIFFGVGSSRGRKRREDLEVNDVVDFWRVEDVQTNKRLLLRAEMKLPGMAWLEFTIDDENEMRKLSTTAYFYTKSIFGRAYWYFFLPFHQIIFNDLIKQIEKRSLL